MSVSRDFYFYESTNNYLLIKWQNNSSKTFFRVSVLLENGPRCSIAGFPRWHFLHPRVKRQFLLLFARCTRKSRFLWRFKAFFGFSFTEQLFKTQGIIWQKIGPKSTRLSSISDPPSWALGRGAKCDLRQLALLFCVVHRTRCSGRYTPPIVAT